MQTRFECTSALWFRVPLRALTLVVAALGIFVVAPSLDDDPGRALAGIGIVAIFVVASSLATAAVADSHVEIEGTLLNVRFESIFNATYDLRDVTVVRHIEPPGRWRQSLGLSTDWRDRIVLSHGGPLVEIAFARPQPTRLVRRSVPVRRLWIAVREPDAFADAVARAARLPAQAAA